MSMGICSWLTHQLGIIGQAPCLVQHVLELLICHKLHGTVGHSQQARHKSLGSVRSRHDCCCLPTLYSAVQPSVRTMVASPSSL